MGERRSDFEVLSTCQARAYVGGSYFNPAADVVANGRRLVLADSTSPSVMNLRAAGQATYVVSSLFHELASSLVGRELLFAVYLRGDVLLAPFIWDEERLLDFEQQVFDSRFQRRGFFGIPRDVAEEGLRRDFAPEAHVQHS